MDYGSIGGADVKPCDTNSRILFFVKTVFDISVSIATYYSIYLSLVQGKSFRSTNNLFSSVLLSIFLALPLVLGAFKWLRTEVVVGHMGLTASAILDIALLAVLLTCCVFGSNKSVLLTTLVLVLLSKCVMPSTRYSWWSMSLHEGRDLIARLKSEKPILKHGFYQSVSRFNTVEEFTIDSIVDHTEDCDIPTSSPMYLLQVGTSFSPGDKFTEDLEEYFLRKSEREYTGGKVQMKWGVQQSLPSLEKVKKFLIVISQKSTGFVGIKWCIMLLLAPCQLWYTFRISCTAGVLKLKMIKKYYCHEDGPKSVERYYHYN
ncbi:hypothetical protein PCE1_002787 [Barthelona sp. PCE]